MGHDDQSRHTLSGSVTFVHAGCYPPFSLHSIQTPAWYAAALIQGGPVLYLYCIAY